MDQQNVSFFQISYCSQSFTMFSLISCIKNNCNLTCDLLELAM